MDFSGLKLGLFGGTFNPIHFGHLRAAEEAAEYFGLERVVFIPAAWPPHKNDAPLLSFSHRLKMVEMAVAGRPGFEVSDLEDRRAGPSYTVETLEYFKGEVGEEGELFFVTGLDAILEIHTWKEFRRLFQLAGFLVVARPGADPARLGPYLAEKVDRDYVWISEKAGFVSPGFGPVHYLQAPPLDISSTDIRNRLARNRSIRYLLPESVRARILEYRLYQSDNREIFFG